MIKEQKLWLKSRFLEDVMSYYRGVTLGVCVNLNLGPEVTFQLEASI